MQTACHWIITIQAGLAIGPRSPKEARPPRPFRLRKLDASLDASWVAEGTLSVEFASASQQPIGFDAIVRS